MFIIKWRYWDGSSSGVIPYIFKKRGTAQRFLEILEEHGSRRYEIEEVKDFDEQEKEDGNY